MILWMGICIGHPGKNSQALLIGICTFRASESTCHSEPDFPETLLQRDRLRIWVAWQIEPGHRARIDQPVQPIQIGVEQLCILVTKLIGDQLGVLLSNSGFFSRHDSIIFPRRSYLIPARLGVMGFSPCVSLNPLS